MRYRKTFSLNSSFSILKSAGGSKCTTNCPSLVCREEVGTRTARIRTNSHKESRSVYEEDEHPFRTNVRSVEQQCKIASEGTPKGRGREDVQGGRQEVGKGE
jgi:hypothetical protein